MPVPGEVTLDEMKLLLERAHKGEIIPLYVFCEGGPFEEYWARRLDNHSRLTVDRIHYTSRVTGREANVEFPHKAVQIFTNYWFAYVYTYKAVKKPPVPINTD